MNFIRVCVCAHTTLGKSDRGERQFRHFGWFILIAAGQSHHNCNKNTNNHNDFRGIFFSLSFVCPSLLFGRESYRSDMVSSGSVIVPHPVIKKRAKRRWRIGLCWFLVILWPLTTLNLHYMQWSFSEFVWFAFCVRFFRSISLLWATHLLSADSTICLCIFIHSRYLCLVCQNIWWAINWANICWLENVFCSNCNWRKKKQQRQTQAKKKYKLLAMAIKASNESIWKKREEHNQINVCEQISIVKFHRSATQTLCVCAYFKKSFSFSFGWETGLSHW